VRLEVQSPLHVGAWHGNDRAAGELGSHLAVDVTGDDPAHLRVAGDDCGEGLAIGRGQADLVPNGDPGR